MVAAVLLRGRTRPVRPQRDCLCPHFDYFAFVLVTIITLVCLIISTSRLRPVVTAVPQLSAVGQQRRPRSPVLPLRVPVHPLHRSAALRHST